MGSEMCIRDRVWCFWGGPPAAGVVLLRWAASRALHATVGGESRLEEPLNSMTLLVRFWMSCVIRRRPTAEVRLGRLPCLAFAAKLELRHSHEGVRLPMVRTMVCFLGRPVLHPFADRKDGLVGRRLIFNAEVAALLTTWGANEAERNCFHIHLQG